MAEVKLTHVDLRNTIPLESYFVGERRQRELKRARAATDPSSLIHQLHTPLDFGDEDDIQVPFTIEELNQGVYSTHEAYLLHSDPDVRFRFHRDHIRFKRMKVRHFEIGQTIANLTPKTNDLHARWVAAVMALDHREWTGRNPGDFTEMGLWNIEDEFVTPSSIPKPDSFSFPIEVQVNSWDVEQAAFWEAEKSLGGVTTMLLHDQLPDRDRRVAHLSRIGTYLMRNRQCCPRNPWDPNEWGHDNRLAAFSVKDLSANRLVDYTPEFDPEVVEYRTDQPIAPPSGVTVTPRDSLAATSFAYNADNSVLTMNCTSKAGETRQYFLRVNV